MNERQKEEIADLREKENEARSSRCAAGKKEGPRAKLEYDFYLAREVLYIRRRVRIEQESENRRLEETAKSHVEDTLKAIADFDRREARDRAAKEADRRVEESIQEVERRRALEDERQREEAEQKKRGEEAQTAFRNATSRGCYNPECSVCEIQSISGEEQSFIVEACQKIIASSAQKANQALQEAPALEGSKAPSEIPLPSAREIAPLLGQVLLAEASSAAQAAWEALRRWW